MNSNLVTIDNFELNLQSVYQKLAVSDEDEIFNENKFIVECIETIFSEQLKQIEFKDFYADTTALNNNFVILLKYCANEPHNFKKVGIIFVGFCDYFNLDYNRTFLQFHDKLQTLIKYSTQCMVGKRIYNKMQLKANDGLHITTLFEMSNKQK